MSTEPATAKIKILCVDDEPELLELMQIQLEGAGYEVILAGNVDEGMLAIRQHGDRLGLVVSDFSMPGKTGFDLRQEMMEEYKHIPFIVVSSHVSRESALQAIELKISGFLAKPYHDDEYLAIVEAQSKDRIASILEDDELKASFVADVSGLIDEIESAVLSLEEDPTQTDRLNQVFACAHTIKGMSGFFKPDTIHKFTHRYEDYLSAFKKGQRAFDSVAGQVLLQGLDILKRLVRALNDPSLPQESLESLVGIFEKAESASAALDGEKSAAEPAAAAASPGKIPATEHAAPTEDLRIGISVLNEFMERSGEITVLRNMVNKVFQSIEAAYEDDPNVAALSDLMAEMHKAVTTMQDQISELKKVSSIKVVKPLYRSLRDLSVSLQKDIRLDVKGEDLRIDQSLSDVLSKCLIHLLRNSADHGLESKEIRVRNGKPEHGTIHLHICENQDEILVKMGDDGGGIDANRVKNKAIEKGLITPEQAASKNENELRMLIFEPGFSTSDQISSVSGRGVGMDMVKQAVTKAGGKVELTSALGIGTTFTMRLPVPKSVLIISSLMIKSGVHTYAIPQDNVDRVLALDSELPPEIRNVGGKEFYLYKNRLNPILRMSNILDPAKPTEALNSGFLIGLRSQNGSFFLHVDQVIGTEDIVVKTLSRWFGALRVYKGATFLGDGRIGLILDVDGIAESRQIKPEAELEIDDNALEATAVPGADQFLIFRLNDDSTYALPRHEIFRIEKIERESIKLVSRQQLTIYRGQTMTMINLQEVLAKRSTTPAAGTHLAEFLDVIVVQGKTGAFVGYVVNAIEDLIETTLPESPMFFTDGNAVHVIRDRLITLVRAEELNRRYLHDLQDPQMTTGTQAPTAASEGSDAATAAAEPEVRTAILKASAKAS